MKDTVKKYYNKIYNISFFSSQFMLIVFLFTTQSIISTEFIPKLLVLISLFLLILSIYTFGVKKENIVLYVLILLVILSYMIVRVINSESYIGYDWTVIYYCSYYVAYSKTNKYFLQKEFQSKLLIFFLIIILGVTGILSNQPTYRWGDLTPRYALGFSSPNTLGAIYLSLMISFIYIMPRILYKKTTLGILTIITAALYLISSSRTSMMLSFFIIIYLFAENLFGGRFFYNEKIINSIMILILFLGVTLPFINLFLDDGLSFFNKLLSGRLDMATHFINEYGISTLGKSIPETSSLEIDYGDFIKVEEWVLDNGYIRILLNQGMLFFTIFIFFIVNNVIRHDFKKDNKFVVVFLVILFYGILERYSFNIFVFPYLLFAIPDQSTN